MSIKTKDPSDATIMRASPILRAASRCMTSKDRRLSTDDEERLTSFTIRSCVLTIVPSSISCWVKSIVG